MQSQEKRGGKRDNASFGQKLKEAWENKSIRYIFIAFIAAIILTVLKFVFKF